MAFELKNRASKKGSAELDGGVIEFDYIPGSFTPSLLQKIQLVQVEQSKTVPDVALMATVSSDIVRALLTSWNVTSGGVPVPLSREALEDVPLSVLNAVIGAINQEQTPNPTNSPTSAGT